VWAYTHDADRRLTRTTDPNGHQTQFGYNGINELTSLTDPNSNVTSWAYDVEGWLTQKTYADSSTVTNTYETTTSRLHAVLDALGQTKQYSYAQDNRLAGITSLGAVNPMRPARSTIHHDIITLRHVLRTASTSPRSYCPRR
jgi:YD repeat-containing protein